MKIAVIAANGRTGTYFVNAALQAGHSVKAGVHGNHTFAEHPNLTVQQCDATEAGDVLQLLMGCDAVVSVIGHTKKSPANVQTAAIQTILQTMQDLNIKRIVSLTGTGVRLTADVIPFIDKVLNFAVGIVDPKRIADGKQHALLLMQSQTDWTLIRVLKLQNTAMSPFILTTNGPTKTYVSRQDVAAAILQVLQEKSFIHQAPILSPTK